jgi:hypothetical protein
MKKANGGAGLNQCSGVLTFGLRLRNLKHDQFYFIPSVKFIPKKEMGLDPHSTQKPDQDPGIPGTRHRITEAPSLYDRTI